MKDEVPDDIVVPPGRFSRSDVKIGAAVVLKLCPVNSHYKRYVGNIISFKLNKFV